MNSAGNSTANRAANDLTCQQYDPQFRGESRTTARFTPIPTLKISGNNHLLLSLFLCVVVESLAIAQPGDVPFIATHSSGVPTSVTPTRTQTPPSSSTPEVTQADRESEPPEQNDSGTERSDKEDPDCKDNDGPRSKPDAVAKPPDRRWHFLPHGLVYRSYIAGEKEPRFSSVWFYETGVGWIWESALGGRFPMVRYGTGDATNPEGWQLELEGGAFTRVDVGTGTDVDAVDFRVGVTMTWRSGNTAFKGGTYHISSHIGDEFRDRNPDFERRDYVRDALVAAITQDLNDDISVYGEIGYAYGIQGGAEPLEFQFGAQYAPSSASGWRGTPFAAVNGHLREEFDFGGNINVLTGWQWPSS